MRRCIGASFALFEMKVVLSAIASRAASARGAAPERIVAPRDHAHAESRGRGRGGAARFRNDGRRARIGWGGGLMARLNGKEKQAHTRSCLMQSAANVFAQRGLQQASIDEVAEDAGFTKGAFYANFKSKEELFLAMLDERFAERARGDRPRDHDRRGT